MKRLKQKILDDNKLPTPSPTGNSTPCNCFSTGNSTPSTSSSTDKSMPSTSSRAARSNDTYVCGVCMLAILTIGV